MQGGAYGAFCVFDRHDGAWSYLSYRDPNVQDTLDNYDQTARFLGELELSQEELVKSIIGAIGRIDDYQLPDAKGYTSMLRHLLGDTPELRQKLRDQVLSTTQADFAAFAEALQAVSDRGHVVILGSQEAIDESNAQHKGWLQVTQVL